MKTLLRHNAFKTLFITFTAVFLINGCSIRESLDEMINADLQRKARPKTNVEAENYYEKFFGEMTRKSWTKTGTKDIAALDVMPKDAANNVNWTVAVVQGLINPRPSLDPNVEDEPPLNLNIFIEAKVPLMANVLFPHSIHTYWLSCNNCHPKIFLPEAGANPISMDEIFNGEWCGRCHGKVAFQFWPRENCTRCHVVLKGQSLERETYR